ncbi:MAG: hypothetical protein HY676_05805 [Chloroflexi bacterium]|nr:hypothetical protein [Chloroflexota bacterium]
MKMRTYFWIILIFIVVAVSAVACSAKATPTPTPMPATPTPTPVIATPTPRPGETPVATAIPTTPTSPALLDKEKAVQVLLDNVIKPASLDHTVIAFTLDNLLPAGTKIAPYAPDPLPSGVTALPYLVPETLSVPVWFFWVDDAPFAKFSHPTRFVFVDATTGGVRTMAQGWWPYIDGREVEQWTTTLERWNPKNWAFNNIPAEELPKLTASSQNGELARGGLILLLFGYLNWWSTAYAAVPAGEAMVVVQGWAPGHGTNADFTDDEQAADKFGKDSGTPVFKPAGNTQWYIEEAIRKARDSGAKDIFFYWTGHGGRTDAGGSYLDFRGTRVSPGDLVETFKKFPEVSFKVVIDSCYSGGFAPTLIDSGKVLVFLSAVSATEVAYGDWDPRKDPNPGDVGGEFSSGLWEDLQLILASPDLQKQIRADFLGVPEFVGWLLVASQSALDKDAATLTGNTHPVFKTGAPPLMPTPTPTATPIPTPISTLTPTPTPINTSLIFFHTVPGSYSNVFLDVKGPANTVVTVTLAGPSVVAPVTQTGTIGADGTLRVTWTIYSYGVYSATGTVGGQSFTAQVNVN